MLHPATVAIHNTAFFFHNLVAIAELEHAHNATLSLQLAGKRNNKTAA
jgi:hypothetical protein